MSNEELEREAAKILFSAQAKAEETARAEPTGPEIPFVCPFCNEAYPVSEELAGKKINCRNCHEPCRVDGKKKVRTKAKALPFWLGIVIGVAVTVLLVVALKVAGVL